ncbi:MAG TPA: 3-dehydroquinate synthase [Myxococcota bacterium]|nr:3-dehydroquinate synthase [Myxococcota bacterium]
MRLSVELGERSYAIVLGELAMLGAELALLRDGRAVLVTNDVVHPLYGEAAVGALEDGGFDVDVLVIPDGEAHKHLDTWRRLVEDLLALQVDRGTCVVALGGGVTGDIAGFAAASTMRGLPLVQVPTTLLAMVDSSVGGKTGVNAVWGKNLVGAFHQPQLVLAALDTLATLSEEEYRCGLGEVVKHAVLADADFFSWLGSHSSEVLGRDRSALVHVVSRCCAIKAEIVARDEREAGLRAVLNAGHTLGHALERVLGYGALRHGEAVGIGLVAEAWIAVARGEADPSLPAEIGRLLAKLGLPLRWPGVCPEDIAEAALMDKKRLRGMVRVAYPVSIGRVRIAGVEQAELLEAARRLSEPTEN